MLEKSIWVMCVCALCGGTLFEVGLKGNQRGIACFGRSPYSHTHTHTLELCSQGTQIIPFAVRWYTGEAAPEDDDDEETEGVPYICPSRVGKKD